jgi:hypothetical protein
LNDTEKDPGQQTNIFNEQPKLADSLKKIFINVFEDVRRDGHYWEGLWIYDPNKARRKTKYIRD